MGVYAAKHDLTAVFSGSTKSAAVDLSSYTLTGLLLPASMAGTLLTFEASDSASGTFVPIRNDENTDISIIISSSAAYYPLDPASFVGVRYLKLVSNATETGKTITLANRNIG